MKLEAALPRLLLVAGLVAAATLLAVNRDSLDVAAIEQLTRDLGVWAPVGLSSCSRQGRFCLRRG